jgi:hypothetical protein
MLKAPSISIVSSLILSDDTRIAASLEAHARAQQQLQSPAALRVLVDGEVARGCSWPQVEASCDRLAAAIDGVSTWLPLSSFSLQRVMLTPRVVDWIAQLLRRSQSLDTFSICAVWWEVAVFFPERFPRQLCSTLPRPPAP